MVCDSVLLTESLDCILLCAFWVHDHYWPIQET